MDIYCRRCSEPIDNDYLHDVALEWDCSYREVYDDFVVRGCPAVGFECSNDNFNPVMHAIYDLMGDDVDGVASMLEDAEALGLL